MPAWCFDLENLSDAKSNMCQVPVDPSWLILMAICPVQQTALACLWLVQPLQERCEVCAPQKGWGRKGMHLSHTSWVAALLQGSSQLVVAL